MHLAVFAQHGAIGVDHGRGVVIEAGAAFFEERHDDHHAEFLRQRSQNIRRGPWNSLGEVKQFRVLRDAEVGRVEKLLQAHDLRAASRRVTDQRHMLAQAFVFG